MGRQANERGLVQGKKKLVLQASQRAQHLLHSRLSLRESNVTFAERKTTMGLKSGAIQCRRSATSNPSA